MPIYCVLFCRICVLLILYTQLVIKRGDGLGSNIYHFENKSQNVLLFTISQSSVYFCETLLYGIKQIYLYGLDLSESF